MRTVIILLTLIAATPLAQAQTWSVVSPNNAVKLTVQLADLGGTGNYPKGPGLYYRLEQGPEGQRATVLRDSPMGLQLEGRDFQNGLRFVSAQPEQAIDESYEMPHGKRSQCRNRGKQLTLAFENAAGQPLEIDLRAYDNGAAFRYRLPNRDSAKQTVLGEATGFALPEGVKMWMAPSEKPNAFAPACEAFYENGVASGATPSGKVGWEFPVLFHAPNGRWGLLTESNVDANFCCTRLANDAPHGVYHIAWPQPGEGNGQGATQPSATLPWSMPWRVILVGDSLGAIVESTLVNDVATPSKVRDTSWIRPGRVAWSWWSDQDSPQDGGKQLKFIDLAAEMGWEYVLVDANWDIMDNGNIHDVLRYAKKKGVGVLLWYNSGGSHNVVTEKPRGCLTSPRVRRHELTLLRKWGAEGVKVDFFQSQKQDIVELYQGIMAYAAAAHVLVDFHGCTVPRGWERTWPNLMTMEAVRGAEHYLFDTNYAEHAPTQNTILPFTRNVVGGMDFTPVTFSDNKYPHRTTNAHELALSVVFESGLLHLADKVEAYRGLPKEPKEFLKHVPAAWDDTRFIAGYPGEYIILARRKGDTWYVAGINGQDKPRTESVSLGSWLPAGRYTLTQIGDGADSRSFAAGAQTVAADGAFSVKMLPYGGFVATLQPVK